MTPIKVLHVTDVEIDDYHLKNISDCLPKSVIEFSFVTFRSANTDFVRGMNSRGHKAIGLNAIGRKTLPRAFRSLRQIFKEQDPDIVHTNLFDPSLIGLSIAKSQGRRTALTRHHSDAVHKIASPLKRKFYLRLDDYISKKADHIIAPSQMVRDILVDAEGVPSKKVSIIPYGQTTERYDAVTPEKVAAVRKELAMDGRLCLVFVSRLFHRKGHKFLFEALARMIRDGVNAHLYLVGDGEYESTLKAMCADLEIQDRVTFLGWRDDALVIVAAADMIVHPSLEDALSNAIIESVMLEKPVVATDISGVRDSLDHGKYGEIVEPADAEALRVGIERVVGNLEAARSRAEDGRKYLLQYMSAERVANDYLEIYRDLLSDGKLRSGL